MSKPKVPAVAVNLLPNMIKFLTQEFVKFVKARMKDWRAAYDAAVKVSATAQREITRETEALLAKGGDVEKNIRDEINRAKDNANDAGKKAKNAVKSAVKKVGGGW